mmetsp:Transcript_8408/g.24834  ORF Transcript_8408/g.24834 Transcript_8408/m.24834 type:complete len:308 (-) Transcript_8408:1753-2676(-)
MANLFNFCLLVFGTVALSARTCHAFSAVAPTTAGSSVKGIDIQPVDGGEKVALEDYLKNDGKTLFVFGTYAADFNAIEYVQRLRYYLPILEKECGVTKFGVVLNCQPDAALALADIVDLDTSKVDLFVDNTGTAGKKWGVSRGWLPDNEDVNPFLKLFGMLWGLGAWATLPAVIGGYIGNPFVPQRWIEDALAVGQNKDRWPNTALELSQDGTSIEVNKFTELPVVGSWPRRPLELATLRLQSMIGISLKDWKKLAPDEEALDSGVLTQLGGCIVVDGTSLEVVYDWKDPGICAVANFEDVIKKLNA